MAEGQPEVRGGRQGMVSGGQRSWAGRGAPLHGKAMLAAAQIAKPGPPSRQPELAGACLGQCVTGGLHQLGVESARHSHRHGLQGALGSGLQKERWG